jgi:hypothetical protein
VAAVLNSWKEEYNKVRSHASLAQSTPASCEVDWSKENDPERLAKGE